MNWYRIGILKGNDKQEAEICATDVNSQELMEQISKQKFIRFSHRAVWIDKEQGYIDSDCWNRNFSNEYIIKTDTITHILPLKEDPRGKKSEGECWNQKKERKIEVFVGKDFIPVLQREEALKKEVAQLRERFNKEKKHLLPMIRFRDWGMLGAKEYLLRIDGVVALKKSLKQVKGVTGLLKELEAVFENNFCNPPPA